MRYRIVENKDQQEKQARPERKKVEYQLVISDNFKAVLESILVKGKSNIASRILEWSNPDDPPEDKAGNERKFGETFLDRTDKDDVISYLQANRVQRHIDQGGSMEGEEPWNIRGRAETRIGRIVRKIFGTRFGQESIEKFVNKYKATIRAEKVFDNFELATGEKIRYWYSREHYAQQRGSLNGSCMSGAGAQTFFGIYEKNPEVQLLILKNEKGDKIRGRALIWKLIEPEEGLYFMDRIYVSDDADTNLFTEYARQQGFARLERQTYNQTTIVKADGSKIEGQIIVQLSHNNFTRYPYLDTLKVYYKKEKKISNHTISGLKNQYTLSDTRGYFNEHYRGVYDYEPTYVEDYLGNEILENEARWCEIDDAYCLSTDAIRIRKGEHGRGKWFVPDSPNLKYSDYSDCFYHKDDLKYSDFMKDWIYDKYAVKMYLKQDKTEWSWVHRLELHDIMGKIGDDYFVNNLIYRDQIRGSSGKLRGGDYHFIDDEFKSLRTVHQDDDHYKYVPDGVRLDD